MLYIVVFNSKERRIPENSYKLSEDVYLVSHPGLTSHVAREAGIFKDVIGKKQGPSSGAVFRLSKWYTGFADSALWEWIEKETKD